MNNSIILKALKYVEKKVLPSLQNMQTYCLDCKKYWFKKVIMMNRVIRYKSRCANCMSDKS